LQDGDGFAQRRGRAPSRGMVGEARHVFGHGVLLPRAGETRIGGLTGGRD
jgi:hypothetical protein